MSLLILKKEMKVFKIIFKGSILETKFFLREKQAFFFGLIFPAFLFILFGFIWGSPEYLKFLITGVIGMTVSSDAFFGIGPVIRMYNDYGILKFLKILPFNPIYQFINIFISRIYVSFISLFFLLLIGLLIFKMKFILTEILFYFFGIIIGILLFGFFGLWLSIIFKPGQGRGIFNFLYFSMLFISGTFYPLEIMPPFLKKFSFISPLTHLNLFLRGNPYFLIPISFFILLFFLFSSLSFKKMELKR
jgi:ABC-2 type transport system permease protein